MEITFKDTTEEGTEANKAVYGKEISWKFNNQIVSKRSIRESGSLIACVLPNGDGVFMSGYIASREQIEAAIFNEDGSLRTKVKPPTLISDAYKQYVKNTKSKPESEFVQPFLRSDDEGKKKLTVWLAFGPWYEERVIDPETGEFRECLGSGRL